MHMGGATGGERVRAAGRRAANSRTVDVMARAGLTSRAIIYLLVGILALEVGFGDGHAQADRSGALHTVAGRPFGLVVLWLLAAGFAALTVWKVIETVPRNRRTGQRLLDVGRAVLYAVICGSIVAFLVGAGAPSSDKQSHALTADMMKVPGGRIAVGLVGAGVVVTGIVFIVQAMRRSFAEGLKTGDMAQVTRRVVLTLGVTGHTARGLVFGMVGVFLVQAAITFDPDKAKGLDDTLKTLRDAPAGSWLLIVVAIGVCVFAAYSLCEARWHRV